MQLGTRKSTAYYCREGRVRKVFSGILQLSSRSALGLQRWRLESFAADFIKGFDFYVIPPELSHSGRHFNVDDETAVLRVQHA
jgi:hypothetical protein